MNLELNDLINIEVPDNAKTVAKNAITKGYKHKKIKGRFQKSAVVLSACICLLVGGIVSPAVAEIYSKIPFLGNFFNQNKQVLNIQTEYNGDTITINSIFREQSYIYIDWTVKTDKAENQNNYDVYVSYNGKSISSNVFGGGLVKLKNNEYFYRTILGVDESLPSSVNAKIYIHDFKNQPNVVTIGAYDVTINRSQEVDSNTYSYRPDKTFFIKKFNKEVTIKKITFSPTIVAMEFDSQFGGDNVRLFNEMDNEYMINNELPNGKEFEHQYKNTNNLDKPNKLKIKFVDPYKFDEPYAIFELDLSTMEVKTIKNEVKPSYVFPRAK